MNESDKEDLKQILNMFGTEVKTLVLDIQQETNMEDEYFSNVVSQGIIGAMDSSVRALSVFKDNTLKDEQILTVKAERQRNLGVTVDANGVLNFSSEGNSTIEKQQQLLAEQIKKMIADKNFIETQKTEMEAQVKHNAVIKAMDALADYVMGLGGGGLIPSSSMHTNFFAQNKILLLEAGATFEGNILQWKGVNIATFDTAATATK
jgi:hypothetical protein